MNGAYLPLKYRRVWLLLGYGLIALVVFLSLTPSPPPPNILVPNDKTGHLLGYFVLMGWFVQLYPRCRHWRLALLFGGLGVALECLQGLSGYRTFDYADMLANSLGVGLGWLLGYTALASTLLAVERRF